MKSIAQVIARLSTVIVMIILASCASMPRAATNAMTAGTGAFIGHELSDGEPVGALLGAATGVVAGELLNHSRETGKVKAYTSGYDKGRSDEVKRLYWVQRNLHRGDEFGGVGSLTPSYYEIPVPEHISSDGTIIEPHTEIIEVLEP
ncbi:MAG: hypothetical protein KDN22_10395 [Verrucomicrobiae bacterium]|nr:hypothetical protein [Verrucomicrobiae bacterium]